MHATHTPRAAATRLPTPDRLPSKDWAPAARISRGSVASEGSAPRASARPGCAAVEHTLPDDARRGRRGTLVGAPGRTRTPNLRIRSPLLYPVELQGRGGVGPEAGPSSG